MYKIRLFGFNSNYSYFFDESVEIWHNICMKCVGDKLSQNVMSNKLNSGCMACNVNVSFKFYICNVIGQYLGV